MLNFTLNIPTVIHFGKGQIAMLEEELRNRRYKRILIVTGQGSVKKYGIFDQVIEQVNKAGVSFFELEGIKPNPRLKSVYRGIEICKKENIDFILAVGGGSVIDASKAIAAGVMYHGDVWDFFERDVECKEALPIGCVLTVSATGSEMNGYSVITNEEKKRKLAFGSEAVKPEFSILDPEYTYTVNRYHTAAGIADIMSHIFEVYFSPTSGSYTQDRIAEALLRVCIKYGPVTCERPSDYEARANIMWTSSLALNGLIEEGKTGDWACHAIEHELSAYYDISHGVGLAIITPNWMDYILNKDTSFRFVEYGVNVWGIDKSKKEESICKEAIDRTRKFFKSLGLPSTLREVSISDELFHEMASKAIEHHGQVGNFKKLGKEDIINILKISL